MIRFLASLWSPSNALVIAGAALASWGLYLWWPPLAFMMGGAFLVVMGLMLEAHGD